jgi:hypothetical protein
LTGKRKFLIIAGSAVDGQNSPTAQAGRKIVGEMLDELHKAPHNSASLLIEHNASTVRRKPMNLQVL